MAKNIDRSFLIRFGAHLKQLRESKSMSQAQLAIDCDFDVSVISRIERGIINTSLNNLKLIADALQVELHELFEFRYS